MAADTDRNRRPGNYARMVRRSLVLLLLGSAVTLVPAAASAHDVLDFGSFPEAPPRAALDPGAGAPAASANVAVPGPASLDETAEADPASAARAAASGTGPATPGGDVTVEAPATGAAPDEAPVMTAQPADPVADALRDLLAGAGSAGSFEGRRDSAAVAEFYAQRDYAPAWTTRDGLTASARAAIVRLRLAAQDGLDPADYPTPALELSDTSPDAIARAEVQLSLAIAAYARDAYAGRVDPASISPNITVKRHLPDPIEALRSVAGAADPAAALAAFNPPHAGFAMLKRALAELRAEEAGADNVRVPEGRVLKLGMKDPRVAILRERLGVPSGEAPELYDADVEAAVKAFQQTSGLHVDGILGRGTLGMLNAGSGDRIANVIANMERWRWLPRDLGDHYVFVNIPDFSLKVVHNGKATFRTRVVVGKPSNQTPVFSAQMQYIIVNPYWHVPSSIAAKEMLPEIMANPRAFFARQGIEVLYKGRVVDPGLVNWPVVASLSKNLPISFRQPPGERNALGRIKFMFPNQHAVYLHDTPLRNLFEKDYRAFSHGCVRVQNPLRFADALLVEEDGWDGARLEQMFGGPEKRVDLSRFIPVHLTYFTAFVDEDGKLIFRDDLYGHNARVRAALGL